MVACDAHGTYLSEAAACNCVDDPYRIEDAPVRLLQLPCDSCIANGSMKAITESADRFVLDMQRISLAVLKREA